MMRELRREFADSQMGLNQTELGAREGMLWNASSIGVIRSQRNGEIVFERNVGEEQTSPIFSAGKHGEPPERSET
jgi:hypothetical protein